MCFCVRVLFSHALLLTRAAGKDTVVGVGELLSWQRVVPKYSTTLCVCGWHGACKQSQPVSPCDQQGELLLLLLLPLDLAELDRVK